MPRGRGAFRLDAAARLAVRRGINERMRRRPCDFRTAPGLALALLAGCGAEAAPETDVPTTSATRPPDVILVTIDTLRADRLGCYDNERGLTPELDALAARGVLFEDALAVMPTTVPAHASMLLGTWPRVHGSRSNFQRVAATELPSLPRLLSGAGWRTAAFLSMAPLAATFEKLGGFEEIASPAVGADDKFLDSEEVLDGARGWLAREALLEPDAEPYFLWLHLWDPHSPYRLHPEIMERLRPGFVDDVERLEGFLEPGAYDAEDVRKMIDLYDNEVAHVDATLGRFLGELRGAGALDDALVIVTSDHGESLDELWEPEGYAFDHGEFLHDHQLHVPLVFVPPGGLAAGRRVPGAVTHVDLLPTVLELVGLEPPPGLPGRSLAPWIGSDPTPDGTPRLAPRVAFLQRRAYGHPEREALRGDLYAARGPALKWLQRVGAGDEAGWLARNGAEWEGAPADPEQADELRAALADWLRATAGHAAGQGVTPEEAEALRALGYTEDG